MLPEMSTGIAKTKHKGGYMNINKVSMIKFGNYPLNKQEDNVKPQFNSLDDSEKLNVIYNLLKDVRINQEYNADIFTSNQKNNHTATKLAFQILTNKCYTTNRQHELITDAFERNSIGHTPERDVDQIITHQ